MSDTLDMKNGIIVGKRIITGVIAEWSLAPKLVGRNVAFENDLGVGGNLKVDGLAFDHLDGFMSEETRKNHLVHIARQGSSRRVSQERISADRDGGFDFRLTERLSVAKILRAVLMNVPMHAGGGGVEFLKAIHADVALAGSGIFGDDERQCDERSAVLRPALEDRNFIERRTLHHDLLTGSVADVFREVDRLARGLQDRQHIGFIFHREVRELENFSDLVGNVVEPINAERESHSFIGAEGVDEHGHIIALDVLEQQRDVTPVVEFGDAIGDLGDLELGADRSFDALQQSTLLERRDKFS